MDSEEARAALQQVGTHFHTRITFDALLSRGLWARSSGSSPAPSYGVLLMDMDHRALLMIFVATARADLDRKVQLSAHEPTTGSPQYTTLKELRVYMPPMLATITLNMWPSQSPWAIGAGDIMLIVGVCWKGLEQVTTPDEARAALDALVDMGRTRNSARTLSPPSSLPYSSRSPPVPGHTTHGLWHCRIPAHRSVYMACPQAPFPRAPHAPKTYRRPKDPHAHAGSMSHRIPSCSDAFLNGRLMAGDCRRCRRFCERHVFPAARGTVSRVRQS